MVYAIEYVSSSFISAIAMLFLNKFSDFEIDVVGFLAILGEGSIGANAHIITFTKWCLIPRLLPAPQVLLPAQRPENLKVKEAYVTAVESGNISACINHVAHVLIDAEDIQRNETRCVRIVRNPEHPDRPIRPKRLSPLLAVNLLGCGCSVGLFVASVVLNDGMSMLATLCLSFLSTLTGVANHWDLVAKDPAIQPKPDEVLPRGDLVVRYPNGSFLVVKCNEQVARELYFTREDIRYTMVQRRGIYRTISLTGTLLLMLGVIFLANATKALQLAWAVIYVLLNAAYWSFAALPKRYHWDLDRYKVTEVGIERPNFNDNRFTDALFKAVLFAQGADWARIGEAAAPRTKIWDDWLDLAEVEALSCGRSKAGEYQDLKWPNRVEFSGEIQPFPKDWQPHPAWKALYDKSRANNEVVVEKQNANYGRCGSDVSFSAKAGAVSAEKVYVSD
ncbi:hypothetical protein D6D21_10179 [Aureobasidium pullulans]|uniref:Uncharacterized protein n=2 Tax=Aureobasidium pullulans TaxID=5580 RepID=A0AB74IIJ5_AURPU|nr:hypothetical protein D6D21_10179 [Aureobasidium pullulans]